MKLTSYLKTAILALLPLAAGSQHSSAEPPFRVVAYYADWQTGTLAPSAIPYGKLTHINWFGVNPNWDGSLTGVSSPTTLQDLVTRAHNAKVQVAICIDEGGNGPNLSHIASSSTLINTFSNNVANLVNQYGLDGADVDWEFPQSYDTTNMGNLFNTLYYTLHYYNKTLSAAVNAWNEGYAPASLPSVTDWVSLMIYDITNGANQSTYADQQSAFSYWTGAPWHFAPSQLVMGVPFYGNPNGAKTYAQLISSGANPNNDNWTDGSGTTWGYNGISTVQSKVSLAYQERAGGMMMWTLADDATGSNSLLTAMDGIMRANAVPVGSVISMQAGINNLWVSATSAGSGPLIANASTPASWEQYTVVDESPTYGYGYVALRSLINGLYVSAGTGGTGNLTANKSTVSSTEAFFWQANGYGTFQLQCAANGKWVSATSAGASPLVANASTPLSWETYNLKIWNAGRYEAEGLTVQSVTSGVSLTINADTSMSGGEGMNLASTAVGNQVTFSIPYLEAGSYNVKVGVKKYNSRGIFQLAIASNGGTYYNLSTPQDCYAATATYATLDLGTWTPGSNSAKSFQFTITGKNASSSGYTEMIDFITLTPQ